MHTAHHSLAFHACAQKNSDRNYVRIRRSLEMQLKESNKHNLYGPLRMQWPIKVTNLRRIGMFIAQPMQILFITAIMCIQSHVDVSEQLAGSA